MPDKHHRYRVRVRWSGNQGSGTSSYRGYSHAHEIDVDGKASIAGSSDPDFHGEPERWNPEELLVASLSACHQLWYLGLCARAGILVTDYTDDAEGVMIEQPDGAGQFVSVVLRPHATLAAGSDLRVARRLHHEAHEKCFVARSMNFPVTHEPVFSVAGR